MGINHHLIHKDPSLRQTLCTSWELVPHLVFRARSGFTSVLFCRVVYAHCHWRCPPCLVRRYRVVLVYSEYTLKKTQTTFGARKIRFIAVRRPAPSQTGPLSGP
jgi:hypothetical protein